MVVTALTGFLSSGALCSAHTNSYYVKGCCVKFNLNTSQRHPAMSGFRRCWRNLELRRLD